MIMVRKRKKGKGKRGKKKFRMLKNRQKILASRKQVDNKKTRMDKTHNEVSSPSLNNPSNSSLSASMDTDTEDQALQVKYFQYPFQFSLAPKAPAGKVAVSFRKFSPFPLFSSSTYLLFLI